MSVRSIGCNMTGRAQVYVKHVGAKKCLAVYAILRDSANCTHVYAR